MADVNTFEKRALKFEKLPIYIFLQMNLVS